MKLLKNLRKLGWKKFKKKWKDGIMRLTPEQLLKSEVSGYAGSVLGTIGAGIVFAMMGLYPILLFLVFNIFIQGVQLVQKYQQLQALKDLQAQSEQIEKMLEVNKDV
jgi:magnesium-transporting ATPase (P-type)|tara:strand:- start:590 stop:910 length:321 start_codon:yes stop_codon:yes gene_type:complete